MFPDPAEGGFIFAEELDSLVGDGSSGSKGEEGKGGDGDGCFFILFF